MIGCDSDDETTVSGVVANSKVPQSDILFAVSSPRYSARAGEEFKSGAKFCLVTSKT